MRELRGSEMPRVLGVLIIFIDLRSEVPRAFGGVSKFSCTCWRRGSLRISSPVGEDCDPHCVPICLSSHVYLPLLFHRQHLRGARSSSSTDSPSASAGRKASRGVGRVERSLRFGGLHPEWQCIVGMRVLSIRDVNVDPEAFHSSFDDD